VVAFRATPYRFERHHEEGHHTYERDAYGHSSDSMIHVHPLFLGSPGDPGNSSPSYQISGQRRRFLDPYEGVSPARSRWPAKVIRAASSKAGQAAKRATLFEADMAESRQRTFHRPVPTRYHGRAGPDQLQVATPSPQPPRQGRTA